MKLHLVFKIFVSAYICYTCASCACNVRVATYNCSLNRPTSTGLIHDLSMSDNDQALSIAYIIKEVNPDILLLNEFDYDTNQQALAQFQKYFLSSTEDGQPLYPYTFTAPVNTGVPSGFDLNNDGLSDGPADAYGYGQFPGQYGMVLLSKYPIIYKKVRTFQNFLWKDMPNANLPDDMLTDEPDDWYDIHELAVFRLSSKSHWDVPIKVNGNTIHILVSHPTPPVFDGPEDWNGKRNHDEIRFWADYVTPEKSEYIYDDKGKLGGLKNNQKFIIMGDQNADPSDGDTFDNAINQLLKRPLIQDTLPSSKGATQAAARQAGANLSQKGDHKYDTYQMHPEGNSPGNLRLDYVLVSNHFDIEAASVFWPAITDITNTPESIGVLNCSDHRMVYVDLHLE